MKRDPRVEERVEELLDGDLSPEEVCADAPELVDAVRERWRRVKSLERDVDLLFPSPRDSRSSSPSLGELPLVPGYDVQSELGRGGVGVVYRAWHVRLNRAVALKMLLAGEFAIPEEVARFSREAQVVAGLRHPNIVHVYDVGDLHGRPYFTMELVEGETLARKLAGPPLSAADAARMIATLARAMHVAHEGGVVHRDLKPSNVLMTADGTPKITDFGLARRLDAASVLTRSGATVGTPSYMAPEQAQGRTHAIGPAVDVYALGAILYEMLTGRPPFRAETPLETQMQVVTQDPVTPSRLNAKVGRDLETICLKCLEKDPSRRYDSAAALADDLDRFARAEPIHARPIGRALRLLKWTRRRPAKASFAAGSALLGVAIFAALLWIDSERTVLARLVGEDLATADAHLRSSEWSSARAAIERAKGRLGAREDRADVVAIERDLALAERLRAARFLRVGIASGELDHAAADREYALALEEHAIGAVGDEPARVAERIRGSRVKDALVTALDDWAVCARAADRIDWVLSVVRRADPDPAWRDVVRDLSVATDASALQDLVDAADVAKQPVSALLVLASRMRGAGIDSADFLRRVQLEHADDFWANFECATALDDRRDPDAIAGYLAALAIQPDSMAVLGNLGGALAGQRRYDEALVYFGRALALDPSMAVLQLNYASALCLAEKYDDAIAHARESLRIDPTLWQADGALAQALWRTGKFAEAAEAGGRLLASGHADADQHRSMQWLIDDCTRRIALLERLPGLQSGELKAENSTERAYLALYMLSERRDGESAELFARAFEESPELADDILSGYRMAAARAAASAGGPTSDLDPQARSAWRERSRDWLRADIAHWSRTAPTATERLRDEIRRRILQIRAEPRLEPYRDGTYLGSLAEDEREQWTALWRDLDALQYRIEQAK